MLTKEIANDPDRLRGWMLIRFGKLLRQGGSMDETIRFLRFAKEVRRMTGKSVRQVVDELIEEAKEK